MNTERKIDIDNAKSLIELADMLNGMSEGEQREIDLSSLPTFGGADIDDTMEVWSWDGKNILVADNGWAIQPRCTVCGEATFHCEHDE